MSNSEEEFLERLRATFVLEAEEHLHAMSAAFLALEKDPPGQRLPERLEAVFRHAHSLKGAARAINFSAVESVCQALESVLAAWKGREIAVSGASFDTLHRAVDLIGHLALGREAPRAGDAEALSAVSRQLGELLAGRMAPAPAAAPPPPEEPPEVPSAPPPPPPRVAPPAMTRAALTDTIRISTAKLDRLLLEAEEMLATKQSVAQRAAELAELEGVLADWSRRWTGLRPELRAWRAAGGGGDGAGAVVAEFLDWNFTCVKSLETRIRALGKSAQLDRHDVARRVDDLLAGAKNLVMLPFSALSDLFPKLVRDLSRDQGKQVELTLRGSEIEIDKRILEEMKDPLIHLLRNSVDHGVERPEQRTSRHKPATARIDVTIAAVPGNKIEILVADDGGGIDVARVKAAAVRRGILSAADAETIDEGKARELIFQSEVSTSPIITEISGRGLGLAIVREKTEKLGGWVTVESAAATGTRFRIVLPLTLATFRGVLVRAAAQVFVIPTAHVERVGRIKSTDVRTVENRETIVFDGSAVALVRLGDVLEFGEATAVGANFLPIVVLGSGTARIAFAVDEVLHDEEVLVKAFSRPLLRVRNIAAATVLASGLVAPILNAADLMKSARKAGTVARPPAGAAPAPAREKSILLAEDSITSRMLLKGILESAGYRVKTAVDGVEAWTAVRTEEFDLVVSDVEMPRMNGFDLTAHIRADKKLTDKPVVLVTALASPADRERGIDVGASAYIVKSNFNESSLLEVVRRLA